MTILIRQALPEDAAALAAIASGVTEEGFGLVSPEEVTHTTDAMEQRIIAVRNDPRSLFLTAESDGQPVGSLIFQRSTQVKYVHHGSFGMSLAPSSRGAGIGRKLMEELLSWAAEAPGLEKITLEVLAENTAARSLYKQFQFEEEGRLRRHVYYQGAYDDLILMALFLNQENRV
ncbi:GNAT family N-acetyltransferase [Alkalicoccus luteus]|uniref:GNAT family N-acetyltransferase n=1 Tax=Alkalicoccus luteus TaxID=1237094 RepID=A0A969PUA2_9BACI|nr:GNAT family N-acetyltransferase [Alkalicoccus luteus]